MKNIFIAVAALVTNTTALAHSGHGNWASFGHDYEHALVTLGLISLAFIMMKLVNSKGRRFDKQ